MVAFAIQAADWQPTAKELWNPSRAADWQPKSRGILRELQIGSQEQSCGILCELQIGSQEQSCGILCELWISAKRVFKGRRLPTGSQK
jgi:hypothetical protein